ncbi:DUF4097 family beta strand repeat-containing protein [Anaerobacillus alkaliphilus]|uniref:DUF4097 family beta strand repeat-containing protein n=1 Tax=Anaerobacillus alkaliphilus TaxID=1548597 RepID=UPI001375786B|nr:DUF4097 family beta strand repeat-containing protein [Anaerobacillus alkaliphilus]
MNKGALLGLALIAIGVLALVFNSTQPVFHLFSKNTTPFDEGRTVYGDNITSIEINSSSPSITVVSADREDIDVKFTGEVSSHVKNSFMLDVETSKDTLKINIKRPNRTSWFNFGINIMNAKLIVEVPEKMFESISIHSSSGKVLIEDIQAEQMDINASSGSIVVSNVTAEKELRLVSSSGAIKASDSHARAIHARASSGAITLVNQHAEKTNVSTSSGSITMTNVGGEISANASSGSINLDNVQLDGNIHASTSSGGVNIRLKETPSATVDYKGSSGRGNITIPGFSFEQNSNNNIYGKIGSGDYEITVRTSSGGFTLQ